MGRFVKKRGDDRKKLDVADIMHLYELLDKKKVKIPTFVAANINRISGMKPLDGDVLTLSASVTDLKAKVQQLTVSINGLQSKINGKSDDSKFSGKQECFPEMCGKPFITNLENSKQRNVPEGGNEKGKDHADGNAAAGTSLASGFSNNNQSWTRVGRNGKPERPVPARDNNSGFRASKPLYGNKVVGDTKVRAVTEVHTWHCKIGRLHKEVAVNDIKSYLQDHGVDPLNVEQLKSQQGAPLSMHIEVPFEYKDKVMDPEFWSKGIRVCGWRFRYNNRRDNLRNDDQYYGFNWKEW